MSKSPPLFYLAFANTAEVPLKSLDRESDLIRRALMEHRHKFHIQIDHEPFISSDKLGYYLNEFQDAITVFHFAGHAETDNLIFTDLYAEGQSMARLLANQKSLQLVFLNGCNTRQIAEDLIAQGVPAVIGTTAPVYDEMAARFAHQFYHALSVGKNISSAFEHAQSINGLGKNGRQRGAGGRENGKPQEWFLKFSDSGNAKNWCIPQESYRDIVIKGAGHQFNLQNYPVNGKLIPTLWEALADYSDELAFFKMQEAQGKKIDFRRLRRAIMDCLPAPVGEQVRKLFAVDTTRINQSIGTFSRERLEQIVKTYNTLVELVAFIMLSQLWDGKMYQKGDLVVPPEQLKVIRNFLAMEAVELAHYDFVELIRAIRITLDENDIPYFVEEIKDTKVAIYEDEEFIHAYQFLQLLRESMPFSFKKIHQSEIESYCVQAEEHLGNIFKHLGFCANYRFRTIKQINLIRPRHRSPQFRHVTVKLDTITAGFFDEEAVYYHHLDDESVILSKEKPEEEKQEFLNLSPFVIDEYALKKKQLSRLFYFHYYDRRQKVIYYKLAQMDEEKMIVSSENFPELLQELEDFCELFFGTSLDDL